MGPEAGVLVEEIRNERVMWPHGSSVGKTHSWARMKSMTRVDNDLV